MKKSLRDDVIERARTQYQWGVESARAFLAPTGTKTDRRTIDRALQRMSIEQAQALAQQDPSGTVARRLEVLDARAAALPPDATYDGES